MSTKRFTLQDINDAAEKKYGGVTFDLDSGSVKLRNPLRLSKDERKALSDITTSDDDAVDEDGEKVEQTEDESLESYREMIRICADHKPRAEELLDSLGDDVGALMTLIEMFSEGVELGEAKPSQD